MKFFKKQLRPDKSEINRSEMTLENQEKNGINAPVSFLFLGLQYSQSVLKGATLVKTYHEMRYETVSLYLDCHNRYFIKTYRKMIDLYGGMESVSSTYNFVNSEKEADAIYNDGRYIYGIEPYIYESSEGILTIYEGNKKLN